MGEYGWRDTIRDWFWTAWGPFNRFLVRRHWIHCYHCDDGQLRCDCGADGVPYEVSGGNHYEYCIAYHPCRWCGRNE